MNWKYKSTGQPFDHQMRLYKPGSDPEAPDEMIANVWDARSDTDVFWYEDGIRQGKMAQRTGLDPMSVELHAGPSIPAKHNWVDPIKTSHLFYAAVSSESKKIVVEVGDNNGNIFTETLRS